MISGTITTCPYCGEPTWVPVDPARGRQRFVADCEVCCRPIQIEATVDGEGEVSVRAATEDETL